jgi:hypothetical protein
VQRERKRKADQTAISKVSRLRLGEKAMTRYLPEPYHTAVPGFVYGGLIASLIDCHSPAAAAAAMYRAGDAISIPRRRSGSSPAP